MKINNINRKLIKNGILLENSLSELAGKNKELIEKNIKQKQTEVKLAEAKKAAEKANYAKSGFLANMSHELRTPLNGIVGFAEILKDMETDTAKLEYLDIMKESSSHLLSLVNDVLSLSKIEAGKEEVIKKDVDFYSLIKNIEGIFKQQIINRRLELIVEYDETIPRIMLADRTKLLQILNNLISNSIKFTHEGYIKLTVKDITAEENTNKTIEFSVIDTGIGINEEKQKRLYEPFEQGEHYMKKTYGGSGLGLAIVKKLVDLMNGEIEIKTQTGKGTQITIRLPLESVNEMGIEVKEEKLDFKRSFKILSADDNKVSQALLKVIAHKENWNLKSVSNGKELLEELGKNSYDLILMDIQMPVMDGLEATKLIRENKKHDKLPIIAVSAFALEEDIENTLKAGINGYVTKPLTTEQLKEVVFSTMRQEIN